MNTIPTLAWMMACLGLLLPTSVLAVPGQGPRSTPPGAATPITVAVLGDSLADGIWGALYRRLQRDERYLILRKTRGSTGLARVDYYNWQEALDTILNQERVDAVIMAVGLNDMQAMYVDGKRHHRFRSTDWELTYAKRVDLLMSRLRESGIPSFWLGLPITRDPDYSENITYLNELFKVQAILNNIHFVPLWEVSLDDNGVYSSYLRDTDGRRRLMRASDGIHFTPTGYNLLVDHLWEAMQPNLDDLGPRVAQHSILK